MKIRLIPAVEFNSFKSDSFVPIDSVPHVPSSTRHLVSTATERFLPCLQLVKESLFFRAGFKWKTSINIDSAIVSLETFRLIENWLYLDTDCGNRSCIYTTCNTSRKPENLSAAFYSTRSVDNLFETAMDLIKLIFAAEFLMMPRLTNHAMAQLIGLKDAFEANIPVVLDLLAYILARANGVAPDCLKNLMIDFYTEALFVARRRRDIADDGWLGLDDGRIILNKEDQDDFQSKVNIRIGELECMMWSLFDDTTETKLAHRYTEKVEQFFGGTGVTADGFA